MFLNVSNAPIVAQPVTIRATSAAGRKLAAYHAARLAVEKAGEKATAEQRETLAKLAREAKGPVKFTLAEDATVTRYSVTDDQLAAFLAAETPEARAEALAGVDGNEQSSAIHPSVYVTEGYRDLLAASATDDVTARDVMLSDLAAGFVVLPSPGRGAAVKAGKLTPAERTAAAADALFGSAE